VLFQICYLLTDTNGVTLSSSPGEDWISLNSEVLILPDFGRNPAALDIPR
jgi:hypothetical protein